MIKYYLTLLLLFSSIGIFAQKINLDSWVKYNIDSLHKINVDTIEYYHAYCGECLLKPNYTDSVHDCETESGFVQISNVIIYRQKGSYQILEFNCNYTPVKKVLIRCQSIPYFLSIVQVLKDRNKEQRRLYKLRRFLPPVIVDGGHEEADLYIGKAKYTVSMHNDQKNDKAWRSFFWIDKQTKLLSLIETDLSKNKVIN